MSDAMLTCPKCHGAMRTYERSGVTVDQCGECRGIFLDRGELDRLIDAERDWHADAAPPRENHRDDYRDDRYEHDRRHDRDRRYDHDRRYEHGRDPRKRKKSFLDELFD
jgi:Zn-finger nucleic acid-binding protein